MAGSNDDFGGALGIVLGCALSIVGFVFFVVLKLTDVIDWSWWILLAQFWLPLAIALILALIGAIYALVTHLREKGKSDDEKAEELMSKAKSGDARSQEKGKSDDSPRTSGHEEENEDDNADPR